MRLALTLLAAVGFGFVGCVPPEDEAHTGSHVIPAKHGGTVVHLADHVTQSAVDETSASPLHILGNLVKIAGEHAR